MLLLLFLPPQDCRGSWLGELVWKATWLALPMLGPTQVVMVFIANFTIISTGWHYVGPHISSQIYQHGLSGTLVKLGREQVPLSVAS